MPQMTGIIEQRNSAQRKTRFGDKTTHSIRIGEDWYGDGFKGFPDDAVEGASVEFEFTESGSYKNVIPHTMRVVAPPAERPAAAASAPARGGQGADARQEVIIYQAARNTATELLKVAVELEAVKLPTKQADKYDALLALHGELAEQLHCDAMDVYTGNMVISRELLGSCDD